VAASRRHCAGETPAQTAGEDAGGPLGLRGLLTLGTEVSSSTMSSQKKAADPFDLDLERDMPLTAGDLEALARARDLRPLTPEQYEEWASLIERHHGKRPRRHDTT